MKYERLNRDRIHGLKLSLEKADEINPKVTLLLFIKFLFRRIVILGLSGEDHRRVRPYEIAFERTLVGCNTKR